MLFFFFPFSMTVCLLTSLASHRPNKSNSPRTKLCFYTTINNNTISGRTLWQIKHFPSVVSVVIVKVVAVGQVTQFSVARIRLGVCACVCCCACISSGTSCANAVHRFVGVGWDPSHHISEHHSVVWLNHRSLSTKNNKQVDGSIFWPWPWVRF